MILRGILHYSLGGFTVIRGVAPLGDLERCSEFNPEYQRNLIATHTEEINRFLSSGQYLFFPEVILSACLHFDFKAYKGKRSVQPLGDLYTGKGFVSNVNGLRVRTSQARWPKLATALGGREAPRLAYLELPEEGLKDGLRLFRIDGNHRLSAAKDAKLGGTKYGLSTPFCIVLHADPTLAERFERVVFHNINGKQIPLTSEENLRLILDKVDGELFKDQTLMDSPDFGPAYLLARKLLIDIEERYLLALELPLQRKRSLVLALAQLLIGKGEICEAGETFDIEQLVPALREAFQRVEAVYRDQSTLKKNSCHGLLLAFLFFAFHRDGVQLPAFTRWVLENRIDYLVPATTRTRPGYDYSLGGFDAVDASSLVDVFNSILTARHRQIFVAMAFCDETTVTYRTIVKTVDQINEKYQLDITLHPIRIDKFLRGHSYTVNDEIHNLIEGSGLLIADLTFGNRNVYHEVGYLMGLNQGKGIPQNNFILIADTEERGEELESDIGFSLKNWQQMRFASTLDLEERLTESLEIYYRLSGN